MEESKTQIAEKEAELSDAKTQYEDGKKEYEDGLSTYNEEIEKAEKKISDGEKTLKELKDPDTYVLGRDTNVGYVCFESDSGIVDGVADVFPIFFFLVAALVCVTTMNRMVEEQRTQIGVLKDSATVNIPLWQNICLFRLRGADRMCGRICTWDIFIPESDLVCIRHAL